MSLMTLRLKSKNIPSKCKKNIVKRLSKEELKLMNNRLRLEYKK